MGRRNKYRNLGVVLVSFTAIFAVIAMIFETVCILFGYDPVMHVFKLGSKLGSASVAALFVLSIAAVTLAICVGKLGKMRTKTHNGGIGDVISSVGGFAMAASSVMFLIESWGTAGLLKIFSIILVVLSIPVALYFLLGTEKNDRLTTVLSFFPPIWNAACLIRLYFDSEAAINDPVRILLQVTLVSVMLALMYDLKLRTMGTGKIMFTVTASLSTVLACASFMSIMLLFVVWKECTIADLLLSTGILLITLYHLIRLNGYYKPIKERD
ncbi:MAG: hypothetical protein IJ404_01715 [Clostridia bacterium]|nr:hypothetical protein [Clostridia bacterium]